MDYSSQDLVYCRVWEHFPDGRVVERCPFGGSNVIVGAASQQIEEHILWISTRNWMLHDTAMTSTRLMSFHLFIDNSVTLLFSETTPYRISHRWWGTFWHGRMSNTLYAAMICYLYKVNQGKFAQVHNCTCGDIRGKSNFIIMIRIKLAEFNILWYSIMEISVYII